MILGRLEVRRILEQTEGSRDRVLPPLLLQVAGGHHEHSEDEGKARGVVSDDLGQVGGQEPRDFRPLDSEEDHVAVGIKASSTGPTSTLVVVQAVEEDGIPSEDHRPAGHVDSLCQSCRRYPNVEELLSEK